MLSQEEIQSKIDALGGDALYLRAAGGQWEVILKAPQLKDWEFFLANQGNANTKSLAGYKVVRSMLSYPTPEEFDRLRARWVGMVEGIIKLKAFDAFIGLEVETQEKG